LLAVEADVGGSDPQKAAQMQQQIMTVAAYPPGQTLKKHVAPKTYKAVAAKLGPLMSRFDAFKPWFVAMGLEVMAAEKVGLNAALGLDMHFLQEATSSRKKIVELEGIDSQIMLFDSLPANQQEAMLASAAMDFDKFDKGIHDMMDAWRSGDAEKMNELVHQDEKDDPANGPLMDAVLTKRNVVMANKIADFLEKGTPAFVVVGAGHFVGPLGVVELLKKKGYSVEQR
jgi:uncharacterized protein